MAIYSDLSKLGRVQLPPSGGQSVGPIYALIDVDGRLMLAPKFSTESSYSIGDHVIYNDNLYRAKANVAAGAWSSSSWDNVTVDSEIKRLEGLIGGGIHYRGKTTTALYDGATTNPITIGGNSYTALSGDLVILDLASVASTYATATAYAIHTYIVNGGIYYITNAAITAAQNTSIDAIASKLDVIRSDPEFLFDGTQWNVLGSIAEGLGDLAFKDSASGTYLKPTGSGSVTIKNYTPSTKKLSTTTITGTNGTVDASNITDVATGTFATANATATTVAVAASESTLVGNADVGSAVSVGTSLTGTTTFVTTALKSASLTGTTTFNTDAIKSASLGGTTTFATSGVTTSVDGDCLTFGTAGTGTVTISTAAASTASVGISTSNAGSSEKGTVTLGTTSITPAKAVSSTSTSITGVSGTTSIRGVSGTANAVTGVTYSAVTPAKAAASATTVATGGLETGTDIVTGITSGTESASVTVGTTTDTITVK